MAISDVIEKFENIIDNLVVMEERDMLNAEGRKYIEKRIDELNCLRAEIVDDMDKKGNEW